MEKTPTRRAKSRAGTRRERSRRGFGPILILGLLLPVAGPAAAQESQETDSCVACHGKQELLVQNKKLYDYFQRWRASVHRQEGVSCADCHGGDPTAAEKARAHGGPLSESSAVGRVHYKRIPQTCGECHQEILKGYRQSKHFQHLVAKKQEDQGPNCVTCHGSIDVEVLNVTNVEVSCARCHNDETDNHPENAERARVILNRFLSIQRFYRYITIRSDPEDAQTFFRRLNPRLRQLSVSWHTFDLDKIGQETQAVLEELKAKRDQIRNQRASRRSDAAPVPSRASDQRMVSTGPHAVPLGDATP